MKVMSKERGNILAIIFLVLMITGIWDTIAIAHYMGSAQYVLATGDGIRHVDIVFKPPRNGSILLSYNVRVEPNPAYIGDKYAVIKAVIYSGEGEVLWSNVVDKSVSSAVNSFTDYIVLSSRDIDDVDTCRVYFSVEKITWGKIQSLRLEVRYNPYADPLAYSPAVIVINILSALIIPIALILVTPSSIIEYIEKRFTAPSKTSFIFLITMLYLFSRYCLHIILGIHIDLVDYLRILFFNE